MVCRPMVGLAQFARLQHNLKMLGRMPTKGFDMGSFCPRSISPVGGHVRDRHTRYRVRAILCKLCIAGGAGFTGSYADFVQRPNNNRSFNKSGMSMVGLPVHSMASNAQQETNNVLAASEDSGRPVLWRWKDDIGPKRRFWQAFHRPQWALATVITGGRARNPASR